MNNVMLDLETLGTRPGSVILSIGAVRFGLAGLGAQILITIDVSDAQRRGLTIDGDTVRWWLGQSAEAKQAFGLDGLPLQAALENFAAWMRETAPPAEDSPLMWGNAPSFDCSLLAEAYRVCGLPPPWRYSRERCYRTVAALYPHTAKPAPVVAHNALADARAQAQHAVEILRCLQAEPVAGEEEGRQAIAKLDTISRAVGVDPARPEGHHIAVHRVLHMAAKQAPEVAA